MKEGKISGGTNEPVKSKSEGDKKVRKRGNKWQRKLRGRREYEED